jgi:exocyst complex component 6
MSPASLSQSPFFQHLLLSIPSLRRQIKDAVTASMKQWLLEIRNISGRVGELALEAMEARTRRWRSRREKDPLVKLSRVGSAVEMVTYEKTECKILLLNAVHTAYNYIPDNVLDNDKLQVDFKPLYQCIHIYTALDSLDELRKSYQADRKVSLIRCKVAHDLTASNRPSQTSFYPLLFIFPLFYLSPKKLLVSSSSRPMY